MYLRRNRQRGSIDWVLTHKIGHDNIETLISSGRIEQSDRCLDRPDQVFPLSRYLGKLVSRFSSLVRIIVSPRLYLRWLGSDVRDPVWHVDTDIEHVTHVGLTHVDKPCQIVSLPETISHQVDIPSYHKQPSVTQIGSALFNWVKRWEMTVTKLWCLVWPCEIPGVMFTCDMGHLTRGQTDFHSC